MEGRESHQHRGKFTEGLLNNNLLLRKLDILPGQTILDAGCGNGYMSKLFSKAVSPGGRVYALDPDPHFIDSLTAETRGTNIETMVGDITKPTPFHDASLDLIYVSTVFHGFSRQQISGFIREIQRVLKPDALLSIVEIEKKETPFGPPLHLRYSPEELQRIIPLAPAGTIQAGAYFYMQMFKNSNSELAAHPKHQQRHLH